MAESSEHPRTLVLKKRLSTESAIKMVDEKKVSLYQTITHRPKKTDIHVHSITLIYEAVLSISGSYKADYYRKATHQIKVDQTVTEVLAGTGIFLPEKKSGLKRVFSYGSKVPVTLKLEEHVVQKAQGTIHLDHHGRKIAKMAHNTKSVESYGARILDREKVRSCETPIMDARAELKDALKDAPEGTIRDLVEKFDSNRPVIIYLPVYEARLVDRKKRVKIMRIDAIKKRIL